MSGKSHDEIIREAYADASTSGTYHHSTMDTHKKQTIADKDNSYTKRRLNLELSPEQTETPIDETDLHLYDEKLPKVKTSSSDMDFDMPLQPVKRQRFGSDNIIHTQQSTTTNITSFSATSTSISTTNTSSALWDATPVAIPSSYAETPVGMSQWSTTIQATPIGSTIANETVHGVYGQSGLTTPFVPSSSAYQIPSSLAESMTLSKTQLELFQRNVPWTDEMLDEALPSTGYIILPPPESYVPLRTEEQKARLVQAANATAIGMTSLATPLSGAYNIPHHDQFMGGKSRLEATDLQPQLPEEFGDIELTKKSDIEAFGKLCETIDETTLSLEEQHERIVMGLVLKIKNGIPPQRKSAFKVLTSKARIFGPKPIFSVVLPLFMSVELDELERHYLVKIISRVLFLLDELVRPYAKNILTIIQPLLIDKEYTTRTEAKEVISSLSKAAGLATMITVIRPDIDSPDEYTRNCISRSLAIVACALGIPNVIRFIDSVSKTQRSWEARHTAMRVIQHIAILQGCSVLVHVPMFVNILLPCLKDKNNKVRGAAALALSALGDASYPYGNLAFSPAYQPLWEGLTTNTGKTLAAFFKAIGSLIPLMPEEIAISAANQALHFIVNEFRTPDEDMKRVTLKVLRQLITIPALSRSLAADIVLNPFFEVFWVPRVALYRDNVKQVVLATADLAEKVGGAVILEKLCLLMRHENEIFRRMVIDCVQSIIIRLGINDITPTLEGQLMDALLYAYQSDTIEKSNTNSILKGLAIYLNALDKRAVYYLNQITSIITYRLKNRSELIRQQSVDLLALISHVYKQCDNITLLQNLGMLLYENLGEEYPDVLASILGALKTILVALGPEDMKPSVADLLPRLSPILKNQMERVQENVIDLIGYIADVSAESASLKEWMRISFDLLTLLKSTKKIIRRNAINAFGYIANSIGPQEVLVTLLNNLKVQDRTNRVATSIAIAVIAETCQPFMVIPALMNEYRTPDTNVQNGVLKAFSFLFETVGETSKDYIYAVIPLLTDALSDHDVVHRQIACNVVKHLAIGAYGLGKQDAMLHLLNYVWPNMFETAAHVVNAVNEAIEALRLVLGPGKLMQYLLTGLFHPARRVRAVYWRYYNNMYVGTQDSVVAAYPRIPDEISQSSNESTDTPQDVPLCNIYTRWELEQLY